MFAKACRVSKQEETGLSNSPYDALSSTSFDARRSKYFRRWSLPALWASEISPANSYHRMCANAFLQEQSSQFVMVLLFLQKLAKR